MAKAWLAQRWEMLLEVLEPLTVDQEDQIAQICAEEIAAWKARPSMKSLSSLKEPMSDTRNMIRELPLTERNSWLNPKTGKREHIALKHLNYSESEWAAMDKQSEDRLQQRMENQQLLDHPAEIVAKAQTLLASTAWPEVAVALAVCTGRRLSEILKTGGLHACTLHSVIFSGELKRVDAVLKPYEIPVLAPAPEVLRAWSRLRTMVDCSQMEVEAIGKAYSSEVAAAAERHFSTLVPMARAGKTGLFAHLFRAVYPRIAVYWFCPVTVTDIFYVPTILGHYWASGDDEMQRRNYMSTLHYYDYRIGDGQGNIDGRQGLRLAEPGVEVLEVFKQKPAPAGKQKGTKKVTDTLTSGLARKSQTGFSMYRPRQETKDRLDLVKTETGARTEDDVLSALVDEHYVLQQVTALLSPLYQDLETDSAVGAVRGLANLLAEAAADAAAKSESPVAYIQTLIAAKRDFRKSYEKRHVGKDYSTMTLTDLRHTKTSEAAAERFRRATEAIMAYNDQASMPELRWFLNAAAIVDLVGGRPPDAKEYLESREDVKAHHAKYNLTPGYNRRSIKITERIIVPEEPVVVAAVEETVEPAAEE
ncbi:MAG: protelomerase family protein [Ktedonobacteraceae bacterium]